METTGVPRTPREERDLLDALREEWAEMARREELHIYGRGRRQ